MSKHKKKQEAISDRDYEPADYDRNDSTSQGLATTHEQVSDTLTEGTYDAKIDQVDKDGGLISHKGESINRKRKK
ncbi:YozQ family protein [Halobacillus shinanisalinarum]|uniref:YozQ family protein n=1 Tax=Halobacillus shinanisalinarum TaxID=2932258 RepID=A0ABY4H1J0_9BACI|nr:YozQ family protein [Halobacillus shinanisalinarum]UOQ94300.1 YozQ family protein [Halobacillus shinanisalinarum]